MDEFNILDEIKKRIQEEEDNAIAKAFTMYIGDLLIRNGIKPIITKVEIPYEECSSANEYQLVSKYGYIFERLDTTEHDKQIENNAYQQGKKDKEKELKEHNVFVSNIAIEDIVLDARKDEREQIVAELEEIKHKVYSTYFLSENNIDLGITYGLEKAIEIVRGDVNE